jgi:hypothetical protein
MNNQPIKAYIPAAVLAPNFEAQHRAMSTIRKPLAEMVRKMTNNN